MIGRAMRALCAGVVVVVALVGFAAAVASARTVKHGPAKCRTHQACAKAAAAQRAACRRAQQRARRRHRHVACPARRRATHPAKPASAGTTTAGSTPSVPLAPGSTGLPISPGSSGAAGGGQVGRSPAPPTGSTGSTGTVPTPTPAPPARLQVTGREYSLALSHAQIASGSAIIEFVDSGQDPHNLHIRVGATGPDVGSFDTAQPGSHTDQSFSLSPGTYTLYCSLPGHEALGMNATLVVGP
jgi:plastocyanin